MRLDNLESKLSIALDFHYLCRHKSDIQAMGEIKNKLGQVPKMLLVVIVLLSALTAVGSFTVAGWTPKKVTLYADLAKGLSAAEDLPDDSVFFAYTPIPAVSESAESSEPSVPARPVAAGYTPIEDFSDNGLALWHFFDALERREELGRPVRIAFLGDSFIEGDILTSDVREYLQEKYGGRGVGFVPMAPIDIYRNTLNITHEGWKVLNSLYGENKSRYLFAGQSFVPEEGSASFGFQATNQREHAKNFNTATLLYATETLASITYKLGGGDPQEAELRADNRLRLFPMKRTNMRSGELYITADEGFTGYGVFLNDETGVCVDNYSLRSASGMQLSRVNAAMLAQLNELVPYDLVVLQYGMNVMEADRQDYSNYTQTMIRVVKRLQETMPEVSFLILGVGDRNFRLDDGTMGTKIGVLNLVEAQREIARQTGVAFWNTYLAMGGRNSMSDFVNQDPPQANKDYTHINYHGGRRIGRAFGEALVEAHYQYE